MKDAAEQLDDEMVPFPEHALSLLALTVAVGGRIIVRHGDMVELSRFKLLVTEDVATGDKTYEAIRVESGHGMGIL